MFLKSIRPWQLCDIRRNLRVRAHQCASTVLSTKDSVSHRASGHPWQNLDYDSITTREGEVKADDLKHYCKTDFFPPPFPERERVCICEATINRSEHHFLQRRVGMVFLNMHGFHEGTQWVKPIPQRTRLRRSHSSAAGEDAVRADLPNQRTSTRILHGALSLTPLPSRAKCVWFCSPFSSRAPVREADASQRLWISELSWARRDMNKCSKTLLLKPTIYTAKISSRWTRFQSPISQTLSRWHSPYVRTSSLTR